jgi:hypothetical protein
LRIDNEPKVEPRFLVEPKCNAGSSNGPTASEAESYKLMRDASKTGWFVASERSDNRAPRGSAGGAEGNRTWDAR